LAGKCWWIFSTVSQEIKFLILRRWICMPLALRCMNLEAHTPSSSLHICQQCHCSSIMQTAKAYETLLCTSVRGYVYVYIQLGVFGMLKNIPMLIFTLVWNVFPPFHILKTEWC
jgi:hypothetical protein